VHARAALPQLGLAAGDAARCRGLSAGAPSLRWAHCRRSRFAAPIGCWCVRRCFTVGECSRPLSRIWWAPRLCFDAEQTLISVRDEHCTALIAVPTMLKRITALPNVSLLARQSRLRVIASGGAALDRSVVLQVQRLFGPVLHNLYGSTETAFITIATPRDLRAAPDAAGRPPVGVRLSIRDEGDFPVINDRTGEIYVRTPSMVAHYADGSPRAAVDSTVGTGDLDRADRVGRLFIEGRADRMVVCGGENVYPEEAEAVLRTHSGIRHAAVMPVADPDFGQRPSAIVVAAWAHPSPTKNSECSCRTGYLAPKSRATSVGWPRSRAVQREKPRRRSLRSYPRVGHNASPQPDTSYLIHRCVRIRSWFYRNRNHSSFLIRRRSHAASRSHVKSSL
jgi:acyl-CoA synthetase (AMP-forming)/AMP-acid ligase II